MDEITKLREIIINLTSENFNIKKENDELRDK